MRESLLSGLPSECVCDRSLVGDCEREINELVVCVWVFEMDQEVVTVGEAAEMVSKSSRFCAHVCDGAALVVTEGTG